MLAFAAALLAALALAGWMSLRRARLRRRVRARREPRLRHPVVLAHGAMGFDEIAIGGRRHQYFRKIGDGLRELGAEIHHPRVPAVAPVAVRAERLQQLVQGLPADR